MLRFVTVSGVALFVCLVAGVSAARADGPRLSAALNVSAATVTNGVADVTFTVEVANEDAGAASNVWLVFADGMQVAVGEVPGEGRAASGAQTHTFDLSKAPPTHNIPLHVTLKYSIDGRSGEKPSVVILRTQ